MCRSGRYASRRTVNWCMQIPRCIHFTSVDEVTLNQELVKHFTLQSSLALGVVLFADEDCDNHDVVYIDSLFRGHSFGLQLMPN